MDFKSLVWGDEWKMGCPKSPMWESEGEAWSEDEDASSSAAMMRCTSSGCMGLLTRSLFSCRIRRLAKVALSCHMALDMLCQEMHEAWWLPSEPLC